MAETDHGDDDKRGSIARLLMRYRSNLLGYIIACVRNFDDSEEIFQEVAVTVVSSFDKLRNESEFLPWAREIARRHVLSYLRKSSRPMAYDTELVSALARTAEGMEKHPHQTDRAEALSECLAKLPEKSRTLLQMRYGESASNVGDIANYLGRSMAATYGVLKRIRIALRECVEKNLIAEDAK